MQFWLAIVQQLATEGMSGNALPMGWGSGMMCSWNQCCKHPTAVCEVETAQKRDAALWPKGSFNPPGELGVGYISVC